MALLIVADTSSLRDAANRLGAAAGAAVPGGSVPSVGDPGADGALGDFAAAVHRHAALVAGAAERGSRSMTGYVVGFHQAGGA